MTRVHFIGVDCHCQTCDVVAVNERGGVVLKERCQTTISALVEPV